MLEKIVSSPLCGAVVGGLVTGAMALLATWWTLSWTLKNQSKLLAQEQRQRQTAAGWALIAEIGDNLTTLKAILRLAEANAPTQNIRANLRLNRYVYDRQLPLLAQGLGLTNLYSAASAYSTISNLFGILVGKWEHLPPNRSPSDEDVRAIKAAVGEVGKLQRLVAKATLTAEELKVAGLAD
jgi:hypothetical protein